MRHPRKDEPKGSASKLDSDRAAPAFIHNFSTLNARPRTDASLRAERAFQHWTATPVVDRPLELAAVRVARVFDCAMRDEGFTNESVADAVGVHEKEIRQWRAAKKRIPLAAIFALPPVVAAYVLRAIASQVKP